MSEPEVSGIYVRHVEKIRIVRDHRAYGNVTIYLQGTNSWEYTRIEISRIHDGLPEVVIEDKLPDKVDPHDVTAE